MYSLILCPLFPAVQVGVPIAQHCQGICNDAELITPKDAHLQASWLANTSVFRCVLGPLVELP